MTITPGQITSMEINYAYGKKYTNVSLNYVGGMITMSSKFFPTHEQLVNDEYNDSCGSFAISLKDDILCYESELDGYICSTGHTAELSVAGEARGYLTVMADLLEWTKSEDETAFVTDSNLNITIKK
jgi:hypothetical protein